MTTNVDMDVAQNIIQKALADFADKEYLWSKMATHCCSLSGSRAVSAIMNNDRLCDETSDYDFYVVANANCVVGMIKALEFCGVVFESPFQTTKDILEGGRGDARLSYTHTEVKLLIVAWNEFWRHRDNADSTIPGLLKSLIKGLRGVGGITPGDDGYIFDHRGPLGNNVQVQIKGHDRPVYDHMPGLKILRGETASGKQVQLIFAQGKRPSEHVGRFHSSAVQAMVSPYGCFHMYYDLTRSGKAYHWRGNTATSSRVREYRQGRYNALLQKWVSRGIEYLPRDAHATLVLKTLGGEGSRFWSMPRSEGDEMQGRVANLRSLGWYENGDATRTVEGYDHLLGKHQSSRFHEPEETVQTCKKWAIDIRPDLLRWMPSEEEPEI